ncbi:MAG: hypothetical protein C5B59_01135 [Bacteroidetes bacterium]|nr:MAG: hypothetical protein C5B59_01135 [Bacteroidota bacterium]
MKRTAGLLLPYLALFISYIPSFGQPTTYPFKVQQERMLWHDNIDRQQKRLLALDGKPDDSLHLSKDENVNLEIADAMIRQVDELQQNIELDSTLNGQGKIKYLRSLESMLRGYNNNYRRRDFPPSMAPALVEAFSEAMQLDRKGASIEPVIVANSFGVGTILVDCFLLPSENVGVKHSRVDLLKKYCELHPEENFTILSSNHDIPFADSLIIVAGHKDIRKLYDYAAGRSALANKIRNSKDSLIRTVGRIASSKSGQLYLPFLDNIMRGQITIADINKVKDNNLNYYKLLVSTRMDYAERMLPPVRDTAVEMDALTKMLEKKGKEVFVREINGLHDKPAAVRFKVLNSLTPEELYYLIVLSEDEIYTSSYLGVYDRIFQRMAVPRGDSLIMRLHGDYFRKFIKMAAAYNKLDHFLATMDQDNASTIMKAFIIGLERASEEEAVDVADSYSSIFEKNTNLAQFVLSEVKWNYKRNIINNDKKGTIIYNLLETLFESADTTNKIDLSSKLGIAPVYSVNYDSLVDDSGRVVQQVFFYGDEDKDGQHSFADFMALFQRRPEWKITENPTKEWVTIHSVKGRPILIFANKPLYGEDDPDDKAQHHLDDYLYDNKLKPTIYIHRGHSYHVRYTLKQIESSAKIVVLGSCGGYNNLSDVLTISNDAHIISSKQVGTKTVNEPILKAIDDNLLEGKNIDWITMWKQLSDRFQKDPVAKERFDDYIPPYKNLGAIFIKAYRRAMGQEE